MKKTVIELDLKGYSDIARELEEHLSAEVVMQFNEQIQTFVDAGLKATESRREETVMATTGDGAIVVFDAPATGHRFAEMVHEACRAHNHGKSVLAARRWFRIGIATGDLVLETLGATRKMAGSVIARAVRLEAAANIGEILADTDTYAALPGEIQARYGAEERIAGNGMRSFRPTAVLSCPDFIRRRQMLRAGCQAWLAKERRRSRCGKRSWTTWRNNSLSLPARRRNSS